LRVAALYDVHGMPWALEAVLAENDADAIVFGGDLAWGPYPREALALIRELKAIRPGLVRRCKALVFVMSPDEQERHRARLASSDRFWGCPVEVAERLDDARALAHARLAAGG
jgi:hypothetical protein